MSLITTITLQTSCAESKSNIQEINKFLTGRNFNELVLVSNHYSGHKLPQTLTYGAVFNFFHIENEFIELTMGLTWKYPENLVVLINSPDSPTNVYRIAELKLDSYGEQKLLKVKDNIETLLIPTKNLDLNMVKHLFPPFVKLWLSQ